MTEETVKDRLRANLEKARAAKAAKAAARTDTSTLNAQKPETPVRTLARGQYLGRNGEVLQRSDTTGQDPYNIDPRLMEDGWDYQWIAIKVAGSTDAVRQDHLNMETNGWRPVNATGQWNGKYYPPSFRGHIILGDVGLYERPMAMSEAAKAEELSKAYRQINDQHQVLQGKTQSPDAVQIRPERYRGSRRGFSLNIAPDKEAPVPSHRLADDA